MYEPNYPIVGLSSKDAPQGRLFTLLHELCHLLYHDSDLFLNPYTERLLGEHKETERTCNQFAANFLLPKSLFEKAIAHLPKNGYIKEGDIDQLAKKFCVGRIVVVRRLHDLQYVNRSFYQEKQKLYASQYSNKSSETKKSDGGGPGHYRSKISQLGKTYLAGVFEQLESGNLPPLEASQLIGVKIDNFEKLADKLAS
jgi:Zn-dependent peptidase ImmA (M78 family)